MRLFGACLIIEHEHEHEREPESESERRLLQKRLDDDTNYHLRAATGLSRGEPVFPRFPCRCT